MRVRAPIGTGLMEREGTPTGKPVIQQIPDSFNVLVFKGPTENGRVVDAATGSLAYVEL